MTKPTPNELKFSKINLQEYEGKCLGIVDGKILFKDINPAKVMKRLLSIKGDKETSLICVPSKKTTMAI